MMSPVMVMSQSQWYHHTTRLLFSLQHSGLSSRNLRKNKLIRIVAGAVLQTAWAGAERRRCPQRNGRTLSLGVLLGEILKKGAALLADIDKSHSLAPPRAAPPCRPHAAHGAHLAQAPRGRRGRRAATLAVGRRSRSRARCRPARETRVKKWAWREGALARARLEADTDIAFLARTEDGDARERGREGGIEDRDDSAIIRRLEDGVLRSAHTHLPGAWQAC